jgi:hypothetical protein
MHSFSASFENEIGFDAVVCGRAQILLRGTFSGLERLRLFYPLGLPLNCQAITETRLILDFELSLASLRSEELQIVTDQKSKRDSNKNGMATFEGVVPDHLTIISLVDALIEGGIYVSDVRDNSSSSGAVADLVNRKWEVTGRCYEGPPTDFHLVLIGDEVLGAGAPSGTTNVTLTVLGICTSTEMKGQIENAWMKLERLIRATLIASQHANSVFRASRPLSNVRQRPRYDKKRQLEQLREALADGRISEAIYVQTTFQIQKELDETEPENNSFRPLN